MSININDLNDNYRAVDSSSFFDDKKAQNKLRQLSEEELKISGGGDSFISVIGAGGTVISDDDDLNVYSVPRRGSFVYKAGKVDVVRRGEKIDFDNGNVFFKKNGDIDVTFSKTLNR